MVASGMKHPPEEILLKHVLAFLSTGNMPVSDKNILIAVTMLNEAGKTPLDIVNEQRFYGSKTEYMFKAREENEETAKKIGKDYKEMLGYIGQQYAASITSPHTQEDLRSNISVLTAMVPHNAHGVAIGMGVDLEKHSNREGLTKAEAISVWERTAEFSFFRLLASPETGRCFKESLIHDLAVATYQALLPEYRKVGTLVAPEALQEQIENIRFLYASAQDAAPVSARPASPRRARA